MNDRSNKCEQYELIVSFNSQKDLWEILLAYLLDFSSR